SDIAGNGAGGGPGEPVVRSANSGLEDATEPHELVLAQPLLGPPLGPFQLAKGPHHRLPTRRLDEPVEDGVGDAHERSPVPTTGRILPEGQRSRRSTRRTSTGCPRISPSPRADRRRSHSPRARRRAVREPSGATRI